MRLCSCPYGPRVLWPMLVISAATTCTFYASFECTFFQVTNLFKHDVDLTYGLWTMEDYSGNKVIRQDVTLFFGLWHVGQANSCSLWSKHTELDKGDLDSALKFARVVSMIACVLGAMLWLWIMVASCQWYSARTIRIACCTMLATALFQALSFWALKSRYCVDKNCTVDFAGWIGVAACILWLIAICAALRLRDPNTDPQKKPLRRRPRRLFRRRKPQPKKVYPEADEPSQEFQPDDYAYRDRDPEDPPPEEEGVLVPYGGPRDFVIDDDDEQDNVPPYRDDGYEQQTKPYSDDEPVVNPYDQDPFINASDYDDNNNNNDPRVYPGQDPDYLPREKVYGSDNTNFEPGDRVYGRDDPFAMPYETVYGSDDPNAMPGEKVYGSDDPNHVPGDRVFGGDDPSHVPREMVYGSDDPNFVPGDRVFGGDDPQHIPRETVYGGDDPNYAPGEKVYGSDEPRTASTTEAPDLLSGEGVLVPVQPTNPFASLAASTEVEDSQPDDLDDDDDDDEINQANLYGNTLLNKAPHIRPTSTAPDTAPRSRPSSRASSRDSNQYESRSRPSSAASNRSTSTTTTVGKWELSFD